jgi:hypothetical protein
MLVLYDPTGKTIEDFPFSITLFPTHFPIVLPGEVDAHVT